LTDEPKAGGTIARRLPGFDARHATRRARRTRRTAKLLVLAAIVALGLYLVVDYLGGSGASRRGSPQPSTAGASGGNTGGTSNMAAPKVTAALSPNRLTAPITSAVALAGPSGTLVIAGGSTSGGALAPGVFSFDTSSGALSHAANLTVPLEGASGTVIGSQAVFFGGASPAALATVQAIALPGGRGSPAASAPAGAQVPVASVLGALPQPRANSCAVVVGTATYLLGGDDGTSPSARVLSTTDGRAFSTFGSLAVPVRSGAAASIGRDIYVFGGQSGSSTAGWTTVDTIQVFDTKTKKSRVVGRLPEPLAQEGAVSVGHGILVFGGTPGPTSPAASAAGATATTTGASATAAILWYSGGDRADGVGTELANPVSGAAVTVAGSTVWIVGGQSDGTPVSSVQSLDVKTG
jgi:hypothetical protein